MKSHPSLSANSRSWRSFRVSDGIGIGTPGRFTPLWDVTVPPTTMPHRNRPDSTASTRSRIIPSSINTSCPGRKTSPMAAGATGSSPLAGAVSARHHRHLRALRQDQRLVEPSDAELRPLQVADQRERPADLLLDVADELRSRRMIFMSPV